jgi:hypothetical protein
VSENEEPSNEKTKKHRNTKKHKKWLKSCEHKSDQRTAAYIASQLGEVQDTLCDLMPDMRTFEHHFEMEYAVFCVRMLQRIKRKYRKFADDGVWPNGEDE